MHHLRPVVLLAASGLLGACATVEEINADKVADVPVNQRSYVLGEFVVECNGEKNGCPQAFNSISAYSQRTDAGEPFTMFLNSTQGGFGGNTEHDFVNPDKNEQGLYFCQIVPAGDYQFYSWSYMNFAGGGSGFSLRDEGHFNLPFTVAPGQAVHIGRIKMTTEVGRNMFGMKLPAPGIMQISEREADIQRAQSKCPAVARDRPVDETPLRIPPNEPTPFVVEAN